MSRARFAIHKSPVTSQAVLGLLQPPGYSSPCTFDLHGFVIPIIAPPIVEIDTEATAAYIRLRETQVVRTELFGSERGFMMLDFDAAGDVVGIEVIGQQEFSIRELIRLLPVQTTEAVLDRTRYVSAKLQAA